MAYKVVKKQPKPRSEDMLSKAPPVDEDNSPVGDAPYDTAAPGLYPKEALVEIEGGHFVAVSVDVEWVEGFGAALHGCARWCDKDGKTFLTPDKKHVEVKYSTTVDTGALQAHGLDAYKREVLLLLLGEDPDKHGDEPDETGRKHPILMVPDHDRLLVNTKHHIKCVQDVAADGGALSVL